MGERTARGMRIDDHRLRIGLRRVRLRERVRVSELVRNGDRDRRRQEKGTD
jgi:hypothetical protein